METWEARRASPERSEGEWLGWDDEDSCLLDQSDFKSTKSGCPLCTRQQTKIGSSGTSQMCQQQKSRGYSITSSARAKRVGGIVNPSALAVFRLMTSSTLVLCWIGRSAGLAPLRIFPT